MKYLMFAASALLLASPAATQTPAPSPSGYGAPIGVSEAVKLVDKGMKLAEARKFKMAFAVVEPSGELVAFAKMDDTVYASAHLAREKARSAARFRRPTEEFETRVIGGRTVLLSSDEFLPIAGGIPIVRNGRVIGALGVSGGSAAEDAAIAAAALAE